MKLRHITAALVTAGTLGVASSASAATPAFETPGGGDANEAIAVNTEDGATVFRLAFSVKRVTDGVVDQENAAVALASCTDCRTVALAFQVVLVMGGADVVVPVNQAVAYNDQCAECLTFASATQIVVGVAGPVRLTGDGIRQLYELQRRLRDLEDRLDELTAAELVTEVSSIEAALIGILDSELVPVGSGRGGRADDPAGPGDSTTTTLQATTTTSAGDGTSTTTTTTSPSGTATTSGATSTSEVTTSPTTVATNPGSTPTASTASTTDSTTTTGSTSSETSVAPSTVEP